MTTDICARLNALLRNAFQVAYGRDLNEMLKVRGNELWILGISGKLVDVCGTIGSQDMFRLNSRPATDTDAGFLADAQVKFPKIERKFDAFLLNVDHFEKSDDYLFPLIVHELAHCFEQIGETLQPTEADIANAAAIFVSLEQGVQRLHTRVWARNLAVGARASVKAGRTAHKTVKDFLETAIPSYDRNGPISVRE